MPIDNLKKLEWAEKNLKNTQRKVRRLMTAHRNWQRRVEYYTLKCREELAKAEAEKLAIKMLKEKEEKENAFTAAAMVEGRRFRND